MHTREAELPLDKAITLLSPSAISWHSKLTGSLQLRVTTALYLRFFPSQGITLNVQQKEQNQEETNRNSSSLRRTQECRNHSKQKKMKYNGDEHGLRLMAGSCKIFANTDFLHKDRISVFFITKTTFQKEVSKPKKPSQLYRAAITILKHSSERLESYKRLHHLAGCCEVPHTLQLLLHKGTGLPHSWAHQHVLNGTKGHIEATSSSGGNLTALETGFGNARFTFTKRRVFTAAAFRAATNLASVQELTTISITDCKIPQFPQICQNIQKQQCTTKAEPNKFVTTQRLQLPVPEENEGHSNTVSPRALHEGMRKGYQGCNKFQNKEKLLPDLGKQSISRPRYPCRQHPHYITTTGRKSCKRNELRVHLWRSVYCYKMESSNTTSVVAAPRLPGTEESRGGGTALSPGLRTGASSGEGARSDDRNEISPKARISMASRFPAGFSSSLRSCGEQGLSVTSGPSLLQEVTGSAAAQPWHSLCTLLLDAAENSRCSRSLLLCLHGQPPACSISLLLSFQDAPGEGRSGELLSQHYFADALTVLLEDGGHRAQQRSWQESGTWSSAWSSHEEMLPEGRPVRVSQPSPLLKAVPAAASSDHTYPQLKVTEGFPASATTKKGSGTPQNTMPRWHSFPLTLTAGLTVSEELLSSAVTLVQPQALVPAATKHHGGDVAGCPQSTGWELRVSSSTRQWVITVPPGPRAAPATPRGLQRENSASLPDALRYENTLSNNTHEGSGRVPWPGLGSIPSGTLRFLIPGLRQGALGLECRKEKCGLKKISLTQQDVLSASAGRFSDTISGHGEDAVPQARTAHFQKARLAAEERARAGPFVS
ncbi:hypothetical protein Anapl_14968 [Anas platyrhynchos]|uniref:Uncharacterized protein n=1 Tax=Anas platyrhynchos TaxID=8839 RepID=R0L9I3_ANAPL|nr:hypothetical protein Anapl_14968 [Anas platyrhynchos]